MLGRPGGRRLALAALIGAAALALWALLAVSAAGASTSGPPPPSRDPFYSYSGSLAGIPPGTILKRRAVTIVDDGHALPNSAEQVLYRTTGELGQPTITVATVIRPLVLGPNASKLVAYQTAYDGLGSICDPSYTLRGGNASYSTAAEEEQLILAYVNAGYTAVVSDYESVHLDWGAGQLSGYGTLDGIRAAEHLLGLPAASTPVGLVGYSGGSIATEFATELAPSYAPGLDIVGAAEGGIPVYYAHNLAYINGSQAWSGVIPAVLIGVSRAFGLDAAKYESAYGRRIARQVSDECINNFYGNYPGLTIERLVKRPYKDFFAVPLFARINNRLIMSRTGTPREPLLIGVGNADGTGDGVMVAADVQALARAYCRRGVDVSFTEYQDADHTQAAAPFEAAALAFLSERLGGAPAPPSDCGLIPAGNSLSPLPVGRTDVEFRYLGPRARVGGVVVELRVRRRPLRQLVLHLRQREKLLDTVPIASLGRRWRRLVLKVGGAMPAKGYYTITVRRGQRILIYRMLYFG